MLALLLNLGFAASNSLPAPAITQEYQHGTHAVAVHSQNRSFITPSATSPATVRQFSAAPANLDAAYGSVFAAATAAATVQSAVRAFSTGPPQTDSAYGAVFPASSAPVAVQSTAVRYLIAAPQTLEQPTSWITPSSRLATIQGRTIIAAPQVDLGIQAQLFAPLVSQAGAISAEYWFGSHSAIYNQQTGFITPAAPAPVIVARAVRSFATLPQFVDGGTAFSTPSAVGASVTGPQPAGKNTIYGKRRHGLYCYRDGWRLLCFESKAAADLARAKQPEARAKVLPKPVPTIVEIRPLRALAKVQGVLPELNHLLARHQYVEVLDLQMRLRLAREEEETAIALLLGVMPEASEEEIALALLLL